MDVNPVGALFQFALGTAPAISAGRMLAESVLAPPPWSPMKLTLMTSAARAGKILSTNAKEQTRSEIADESLTFTMRFLQCGAESSDAVSISSEFVYLHVSNPNTSQRQLKQ